MPHEEAPTSRATSTEPGPRWITTTTAAVWGLTIMILGLSMSTASPARAAPSAVAVLRDATPAVATIVGAAQSADSGDAPAEDGTGLGAAGAPSTFWLGPSLLICLVIVGGLIHRRRERFRDDRRFRTSRADDAPA